MDLTTRAYLLGGFVLFIIVTALVVLAIGKKIQTDSDAADTFDVGKDIKKEQKRKAKEDKKLAKKEAKTHKTKPAKENKKTSAKQSSPNATKSGVKPLVANGVATSASSFSASEENFDDFDSPVATGFGQAAKASTSSPPPAVSPTTPPPMPNQVVSGGGGSSSIYDSPEAQSQNPVPPAAATPRVPPPPVAAREQAPKLPPKDPNAASPFAAGNTGEDEW